MTGSEIAHQRLHNQRLSGDKLGTPEDVVRWLGAVQAQDYAGAKWGLRLRLKAATEAEIDRAFDEGSILRTHVLRPTWHFVIPADIRWMLALSAAHIHARNAPMLRQVGLDPDTIQHSHTVMMKALEGGSHLTRAELRQAIERAGIVVGDGLRLAYILMNAELEGLICSGGRKGKQFTYALLDERAPHARRLERQEALAELARRYFLSRGPATVQDFAKWSGLSIADARQGLEAVKADLVDEVIDGQQYWMPAPTPAKKMFAPPGPRTRDVSPGSERFSSAVRSTASPNASQIDWPIEHGSPEVHLLSIYDEYISGYKDRCAIADREVSARLFAMGNALQYLVVVDGQIAGTWRRTLDKSMAIVETNLSRKLTESEDRAVAAAFQRYGEFLELSVRMA